MTDEERAYFDRQRKRRIARSLFSLDREREIADPAKCRKAIDTVALRARVAGLDAFNDRIEALRACSRWEEIGAHIPPTDCRSLFVHLLIQPQWYEQNRHTYTRVAGTGARRLAIKLHREILASDAAPGLSQAERGLLVAMLSRLIYAPPAATGLSDMGKVMPQRPARVGAVRTFIVRSIALRLREHTERPMHAAIADLTRAALAEMDDPDDPVSAKHVENALSGWSPAPE